MMQPDGQRVPGVTALVLNWNGARVVGDCVRSLLAQDYPTVEVLVVDNASTDRSADMIRREFPDVRLHVNEKNLGFGGGNNVGIGLAETPYVLMCNNDTRIQPDAVRRLVEALEADPKAGSATPCIILAASGKVDATGIVVCPDGLALGRGRAEAPEAMKEPAEVFYASDCCCLYRKAMLDDLRLPSGELYDEDFFAYADETDMGWRAQRRGWKSLYVPGAAVYNHHAASSGSVSPFLARLVERNRVWVAVKNFPLWLLAYGVFWTLYRFFWQGWGALTRRGRAGAMAAERSKVEMARILLQAYWEAVLGLPKMWRKRRVIMRSGNLSMGRFREIFRRFGIGAKDIALRE
ncbi:MAG: glycosyltransferase family 2 protein [Planctomycetota bacterium]|nr:glycosyltransferase family 2 protein [Planctomycetota bacterium]